MRTFMLSAAAAALAIPAATAAIPAAAAKAEISSHSFGADQDRRRYNRNKRYAYREWRGRDGRRYCRKPDGTTGLVVGAVGGALVGRTIDTGGDRTAGTLLGAVGGALVGREIERSGKRRCR